MRGGVRLWDRTEMCLLKSSQRGQRRVYDKKDVFEQDVATKKVTRILDLVPQTARPLRHSAMGQTATHREKAVSRVIQF